MVLNEKLAQCCFNVTPTFAKLAEIIPTFGECAMLVGKALNANMLVANCFQIPTVTQPLVSQHKAHVRELVKYSLIDVSQVYRVYMIWELPLNVRLVLNAYSITILADNCGSGVIYHCGMSRGHCCILGTPMSRVF